MCKILEDMCKEYEEKGQKRGHIEACLENACKMLQRGKLTYEEIAEDFNLPLAKVKELAGAMAL